VPSICSIHEIIELLFQRADVAFGAFEIRSQFFPAALLSRVGQIGGFYKLSELPLAIFSALPTALEGEPQLVNSFHEFLRASNAFPLVIDAKIRAENRSSCGA
jgi:hypothetical protein